MVKLTVLTPTYNRKDRLPALYESLMKQTVKDFQWLIVDDGSTDDTSSYIYGFESAGFDIDYYYKPNGGKHTALNYSHPYIKGEYVCIVDSDDFLIPEAIEQILSLIDSYKDNDQIAVYSFQKGSAEDKALVRDMPDEPLVSDHISFRLNGNRLGDCFEIVKTCVFKEFPFPEFEGEKFVSEGYLWVNIGLKYKTVYCNKVIYICEYLEGGLTSSGRKMRVKSPLGGMEVCNLFLSVKKSPRLCMKVTIKQLLLYICFGKIAKLSYSDLYMKCNRRALFVLFYPAGWLMYRKWKKNYC